MVGSNELVIVGNIARVSIETPESDSVQVLGGSAFNIAAGAKSVGIRPALISVVGEDLTDDEQQMLTEVADLDMVLKAPGRSCHFTFSYMEGGKEPTITCDFGASNQLTEHSLPLLTRGPWHHISCRDPLRSDTILRECHQKGIEQVSIDLMFSSLKRHAREIRSLLNTIAHICVNQGEGRNSQAESRSLPIKRAFPV